MTKRAPVTTTPLPASIGALRDMDAVRERLVAASCTPEHAAAVSRQLAHCLSALEGSGVPHSASAVALYVPGRIEVLGKHTDYAGGRSLLAAPERGVAMVAAARDDAVVRVHDVRSGELVEFALDPDLTPATGWANYPTTALRRLARNFPEARTGAEIAFMNDLPIAAGISSSSALVIAVFLALVAINHVQETDAYRASITTPEELAGYLAAVENGLDFGILRGHMGVGTRGGSEDHTAMLCARPDALVRYAFAPVRFEGVVPLPAGHRFVIASSGVSAEKAGAAREQYNRAAELMREAASIWRAVTGRDEPTVGAVLDTSPDATDGLLRILRDSRHPRFDAAALTARVEQFIAEDREIIPAATSALLRGDVTAFGVLVDQSQQLAERLLLNQVPETVHLARSARELGAAAASAFGAGFGGSVWALVEDGAVDQFESQWRAEYLALFPDRARSAMFFQTRAGPPMIRIA